MSTTKRTGLAAFTRKGSSTPLHNVQTTGPVQDAGSTVEGERQRGKKDIVALTVRLPRPEWERLHQLAVFEGVSIQTLTVRGLNHVFTQKGLPPIDKTR